MLVCLLCDKVWVCACLPFGAFGKLHHNSFPVNRERWLESLQDLEQLRCLLLIKHTETCKLVWVHLCVIADVCMYVEDFFKSLL